MLYGTCSQRQTRAPLVTLCYHKEPGTKGHILLSVHGFAITSYLQSSLAAADVPQGRQTSPHLHGQRSRDRAEACCTARAMWRTWSRHARPTPLLAGRQGMARGFMQGVSWRGVRHGRFVSCREDGAGYFCGVRSSCRKWNVAVSGHCGRAAQGVGANQSARFG